MEREKRSPRQTGPRGGTASPHTPVAGERKGRGASRLAVYGALLGVLALSGCQDFFVYHPTRQQEQVLLSVASERGLEAWKPGGGERIGWYAPSKIPGEAQRVLIFHGNGGQAIDRIHYVRGFQGSVASGSWDVYILEYPGYGSRSGDPGEQAILKAASEAVEALLDKDPEKPVYLVGISLGSGVASQTAAAFSEAVPALLLITPFTSLEDAGAASFPRPLVRLILRDRYDSSAALARYRGRLAVLLAGEDRIVPSQLGEELYAGYDGPKRLWIQETAGHNTLDFSPLSPFWREVTRFLLEGA
ncbi:MAG: alpha/beta hydrolase [Spirochaetaceae bacterium]